MIDNLSNLRAESEGEVWLSTVTPISWLPWINWFIPPLIDQWLLSIETIKPLYSNKPIQLWQS